MGRRPDVTSNREHDDADLLVFVGKAGKVVKIASQVHCKGEVATQQAYRRCYPSCFTDFLGG